MKRIIFYACSVLFIAVVSGSLFGNDRKSDAINHFKSLGGHVLSNNTSLDISANRKITDKDLEYLKDMPDIGVLSMSNTNITDKGMKKVQLLKKLVALHIGQTKITDEGLTYVKDLNNLEILTLDNTSITDKGLKNLSTLSNLAELWLQNTNITDEGIFFLANFKNLDTLYLSGTKITDKSIHSLETFKNLVELRIGKTKITEVGIARLKKKLPSCRIFKD